VEISKSNMYNPKKQVKGDEEILIGPRARGRYKRAGSGNWTTAVSTLSIFLKKVY
jgi:hypothetical protein